MIFLRLVCGPYNPPSSPFLRVTFRQKHNLKWQTLSLQNTEDPKNSNNRFYKPTIHYATNRFSHFFFVHLQA